MHVGCKLQEGRAFCSVHLYLHYIEQCGVHRIFWKWAETEAEGVRNKVQRRPPQGPGPTPLHLPQPCPP